MGYMLVSSLEGPIVVLVRIYNQKFHGALRFFRAWTTTRELVLQLTDGKWGFKTEMWICQTHRIKALSMVGS